MPQRTYYKDGSRDTVYSPAERLLAVIVCCVLLAVGWLGGYVVPHNIVSKILAHVVSFAILGWLWIAVVGRSSSD